jgi:hypothetical protein
MPFTAGEGHGEPAAAHGAARNAKHANRQSFASQQTRLLSAQALASKHRGCQSARRTVGYSFIELNTVARPGP